MSQVYLKHILLQRRTYYEAMLKRDKILKFWRYILLELGFST